MAIEVEFVTLGEAANRIDVPQPTLRGWTDKLEEMGIHYLERNNRNERMFDETDIEIFSFMKGIKEQYGSRRASTTDMAYVIAETFKDRCRRKETDLEPMRRRPNLTDVDIQNLLLNDRFKSIMKQFIAETQLELNAQSEQRIADEVERRVQEQLKTMEARMEEQGEKTFSLLEKRMEQLNSWIIESREQKNKGFFKKIFKK